MSGSSPPSRWKSNNPQGHQGGGQLLQELEALSQSLYQSKKNGGLQSHLKDKTLQSQPQHGISSRRSESLPGRRFTSHGLSEEVITHHDPIPLPGLVVGDPPTSSSSFRSRHSISTSHPALQPFNPGKSDRKSDVKSDRKSDVKSDQKGGSDYLQPQFSSSMIPSQNSSLWGSGPKQDGRRQSSSLWGGEPKQDAQSRINRRLSIQPQRTNNVEVEKPYSEEPEWPEESPDTAHRSDNLSDKKKKVWNSWKPLRALSHIGRHRLHGVFSAYVHAIEGLPAAMNGLRLCVHLRKAETKEGAVQSMPSRVFQGMADFRENLVIKCTLYSNKGHSSTSKFMDKSVIVSVISPDIDELDFGKHQLELSRLMSDLVDDNNGQLEKGNSWDTTLDLTGKAKGAKLVITFNYEVLDKESATSASVSRRFPDSPPHHRSSSSRNTSFSLPNSAHGSPRIVPKRAHPSHSPAVSEPGDDYDGFLAMDHLNLEEPPSITAPQENRGRKMADLLSFREHTYASSQDGFKANLPAGKSQIKPQHVDSGLPSQRPSQSGKNEDIYNSYEDLNPTRHQEQEASSDDEAEFSVVEKGMEINEAVDGYLKNEVENVIVEKHQVKTSLDSSKSISAEESKKKSIYEVHEESTNKALNDSRSSDIAGEGIKSTFPENKLNDDYDEKVVTVDEGDKKDNVTYQTLMQTLDSLLQGTSAKEHSQEDIISIDTPSSLSYEDELTDKQVINTSLFPGESKTSDKEVTTYKTHDMTKDISEGSEDIDNEVELVAGEFLDMLDLGGTEMYTNYPSELDSPRARLLEQFEQENLMHGGLGLNLPISELRLGEPSDTSSPRDSSSKVDSSHVVDYVDQWEGEENEDLSSIMELAESELEWATQNMRSKTRAKLLEDAETEALMQEWGLDEKAFSISPPKPKVKHHEPPPLGEGLGPSVPLKDGGSLRSMDPSHFQANKSSGKLVMQISKAVVVPAEMGSEAVDILRNMASMGVENMALQAMTAMPLEDIAGRPVEHVATEGMAAAKSRHRALEGPLGAISGKELNWNAHKSQNTMGEFLSLEDLAPMAMQQIEALAMDGLKVQSNIEEDEAPYTLSAFSLDDQVDGKDMPHTVKGVTGVHLHKGSKALAQTSSSEGGKNGLMDMAIGLDEWMLLDAGYYDEVDMNKDTMAIMAAHHANHQELALVANEDKKKRKENAKARWGCMGNTVTIAMLVQLRDPLKNNEAVGVPMMAFVQAERMVKPPKLKVGRNVSLKGNTEEDEAESRKEEVIPQFKMIGVHMAGLKAPEEEEEEKQTKKKLAWGNEKQQQTGSRWLLANGMSKNTKTHHPLLTSKSSKAPTAPSKVKVNKGESLWSISSRVNGSGSKWKDMLKLNPHIRNPDVIYENQTIRTR